jgi:hypothetical protein
MHDDQQEPFPTILKMKFESGIGATRNETTRGFKDEEALTW